MTWDWQTFAVMMMITIAAAYLMRRALRWIRRPDALPGCAKCSVSHSQVQVKPLVQIGRKKPGE